MRAAAAGASGARSQPHAAGLRRAAAAAPAPLRGAGAGGRQGRAGRRRQLWRLFAVAGAHERRRLWRHHPPGADERRLFTGCHPLCRGRRRPHARLPACPLCAALLCGRMDRLLVVPLLCRAPRRALRRIHPRKDLLPRVLRRGARRVRRARGRGGPPRHRAVPRRQRHGGRVFRVLRSRRRRVCVPRAAAADRGAQRGGALQRRARRARGGGRRARGGGRGAAPAAVSAAAAGRGALSTLHLERCVAACCASLSSSPPTDIAALAQRKPLPRWAAARALCALCSAVRAPAWAVVAAVAVAAAAALLARAAVCAVMRRPGCVVHVPCAFPHSQFTGPHRGDVRASARARAGVGRLGRPLHSPSRAGAAAEEAPPRPLPCRGFPGHRRCKACHAETRTACIKAHG
ncbi:MAG: hypothetical protein J3K34DRAFT_517454 [Monoraphidium minutum]|nr:MAG: hypothetical protein J3K34DRAFT_517454 [Monoraphidium minutum]